MALVLVDSFVLPLGLVKSLLSAPNEIEWLIETEGRFFEKDVAYHRLSRADVFVVCRCEIRRKNHCPDLEPNPARIEDRLSLAGIAVAERDGG